MNSRPSHISRQNLEMGYARKNRDDYLSAYFDEAPAACIITDSACIVVDANHAAEMMLMRPLACMRDKPFHLMVARSDKMNFDLIIADMLTAVFETSRPLCMQPMNGPEVNVLFKAKVLQRPKGSPQLISWVLLESLGADLI